jgi:coenzyme PQQ precursor peptide PqqA
MESRVGDVHDIHDTPVEDAMLWKKPRVVEVAVGLEINSYACAAVK